VAEAHETVPSPSALRDELEASIIGDLLGPAGGPEEELVGRGRIRDRYLVGMLSPSGTVAADPARDDGSGVEGDAGEGPADEGAGGKPSLFPSSLGLTFALDGSVTALQVRAQWGRYDKEREEPGEDGRARPIWRRKPVEGERTLVLTARDVDAFAAVDAQPDVLIKGRIRRRRGAWLVTLFLVNCQRQPTVNRDSAWLFQAALAVEAVDGSAVFIGRAEAVGAELPDADEVEMRLLDLQYRHRVEFASGHGTATHAIMPAAGDGTRAVRIETTSLPGATVWATDAPGPADESLSDPVRRALGSAVLDMRALAEAEPEELRAVLAPLADAYDRWLDEQQARVDGGVDGLAAHTEAAEVALDEARRAALRLREGIDTVGRNPARPELFDPDAAAAFQFANRAMWRQRVHSLAAARRRTDDRPLVDLLAEVDRPVNHSWRPFQLAFLLINLPPLVRPTHSDRAGAAARVDLLFFPTGGGKTEAYLGLTAVTLAIRRLQGTVSGRDGRSGGIAVLMRYTLRLLTAQQFQRAAALMCACELLRRDLCQTDDRWGTEPFRLGMWVGASVAPNRYADSAAVLNDLRAGKSSKGQASPVQLVSCPWCGSSIDPARDARVDPDRWRTLIFCSDPMGACPFTGARAAGEGLPVVTVDDEIYRLLPAFVISTADKWAQLPWQGPLHLLFGSATERCERHGYRSADIDPGGSLKEANQHNKTANLPAARTVPVVPLRPPDLIIQDELHLISGPLGTLVGLYETAVDLLATWKVDDVAVRPKVIASTATVRRAEEQVGQLFNRRLAVFPPPVLDVEDTFFAKQRPPTEDGPGRRYLGICAPGVRMKGVETRVFSTLLAAAQRLFERYGEHADPWMTLVGYFGALRELGGARRLVDDEVRARLRRTSQRGLGDRTLRSIEELTSRISSTEIPQTLDRLAVRFAVPELDAEGKPVKLERGAFPIDMLLATSMISVGVDVPRLGLLCAVGQPKTTSEYIQATSRVGRDSRGPGLVVTIYNWARPRDLSHYEAFEHYHDTFYRHVEALSVTPFSRRALDRGLTAVLVALARHGADPAWNPNDAAQTVPVPDDRIDQLVDAIAARAARVSSSPSTAEQVRQMLEERRDAWRKKQQREGVALVYREKKGATVGLLEQPTPGSWHNLCAPNSLRETEAAVNLQVFDWDPNDALSGPAWQLGAGKPGEIGAPTADDDESVGADADAEEVPA
jgi:hypothetical protein